MSNDIKELSLRIEKIEKILEGIAAPRAPKATSLTQEEIASFQKVRDVLALEFEKFCGINDCYRCIIVRCQTICQTVCDMICRPCDVECSCGPCNQGGGLGGRVGRFGGLG